jgi:UDP-N-acetylmuramoylalanine--D-glutamate ligase
MNKYKKKLILLLGYGVSNKFVHKFLIQKRKKCIIYDDKIIHRDIIQNIEKIPFNNIKSIIISAGISPQHPVILKAKLYNISLMIDLDLLYKYKRKKDLWIGVTGTNGKTTTVELISHFISLPHHLCGNIGLSIFKSPNIYKGYRIYIIEISSFQLHYLSPEVIFDIGNITNIYNNHDSWHGDFNKYQEAKYKIYTQSILNNKDTKNHWSIKNNILFYQNSDITLINNHNLQAIHNQKNLLLSLWIIESLYIKLKIELEMLKKNIQNKIKQFHLSSYRGEVIFQQEKILIINDSKSSNIHSTIAAIEYFYRKDKLLYVMMGNEIKGDIETLNIILPYIYKFIFFGKEKLLLSNFCEKYRFTSYAVYDTLHIAMNFLPQNGIILFSPGGASFDEFQHYKDRGIFFTTKIIQLFQKKL